MECCFNILFYFAERYRSAVAATTNNSTEVTENQTPSPSVEMEISPPEVPPRPKDKKRGTPPVSDTNFSVLIVLSFVLSEF